MARGPYAFCGSGWLLPAGDEPDRSPASAGGAVARPSAVSGERGGSAANAVSQQAAPCSCNCSAQQSAGPDPGPASSPGQRPEPPRKPPRAGPEPQPESLDSAVPRLTPTPRRRSGSTSSRRWSCTSTCGSPTDCSPSAPALPPTARTPNGTPAPAPAHGSSPMPSAARSSCCSGSRSGQAGALRRHPPADGLAVDGRIRRQGRPVDAAVAGMASLVVV